MLLRFQPFVSLELTYRPYRPRQGYQLNANLTACTLPKQRLIIFIDEYPLRHDHFVYSLSTEVPVRSADLLSVSTEPMVAGVSAELTLATGCTIDF